MCRLAAYIGPNISLGEFILAPEHSLYRQSWAPAEMDEAKLNADGFGFGWYLEDNTLATYKNILPIWSDINLESLSLALRSPVWMANVRSATPGQSTDLANTQPFTDKHLMFMHNGYLENFGDVLRGKFHEILPPQILSTIDGNTDSEYLFALFRHTLQVSNQDIARALVLLADEIKSLCTQQYKALTNILIARDNKLYALKYAINGQCPTLYFNCGDSLYPDAVVIASERMTTSSAWQPVEDNSVMVFSEKENPSCITL